MKSLLKFAGQVIVAGALIFAATWVVAMLMYLTVLVITGG
jgi:hypothetical protein